MATLFVLRAMSVTRGKYLADFWAWEMTPIPAGLPSWKQIRVGLAMAIGLDFVGRAYQRKLDEEHNRRKARPNPLTP